MGLPVAHRSLRGFSVKLQAAGGGVPRVGSRGIRFGVENITAHDQIDRAITVYVVDDDGSDRRDLRLVG